MLNFPDAPVVGDEYTSAGATWSWDGVVWNLLTGGMATDYVQKTGDTMTGDLTMSAAKIKMGDNGGLHWTNAVVSDKYDFSKHICLYGFGGTSEFGFTITSGTLNYIVESGVNKHDFWCGTTNALSVQGTTSYFNTHLQVTGRNLTVGGETIMNGLARANGGLLVPEADNIQFNNTNFTINGSANAGGIIHRATGGDHWFFVEGERTFIINENGGALFGAEMETLADDIGVAKGKQDEVSINKVLVAMAAKVKQLEAEIAQLRAQRR